ncbi:hypothetical protein D910_00142, partial [Dendroctonus ponderosae]
MLVCAPANAACNMLTEKLAKFCRPNELRRIMSESCDTTSVHKDILKYCNLVEIEKQRDVIRVGIAELKEFRIVVTTLILAAKYTKEYHPDIIFVDEAAQAREPELCCAMGLLIKTKRLVLAGDPKQLGPAVSAGAISDPLAQTYVYPLIHNHRNIARTTPQNDGSPIEFCSVIAKEQREGRSPSFYNLKEVQMVKAYVEVLTKTLNVATVDIGIVTPYMRQVMYKIREALQRIGENEMDVGTTEAFQGREKRVMIISTVRAQEDFLLYDNKYKLGFVDDSKVRLVDGALKD